MAVVDLTDSTVQHGVVLVTGLVAGAVAAFVVDGVPDLALPAVGLLVVAIVAYLEHGRD